MIIRGTFTVIRVKKKPTALRKCPKIIRKFTRKLLL